MSKTTLVPVRLETALANRARKFFDSRGLGMADGMVELLRQAVAAEDARIAALATPRIHVMDASWKNWVRECVQARTEPSIIVEKLTEASFAPELIRQELGELYPDDSVPVTPLSTEQYDAISKVRITRPESGAVKFDTDKAQLYTIRNFMSAAECEAMMELIRNDHEPSGVAFYNGDDNFRTSSTCYLREQVGSIVGDINQRMAKTLGISNEYAEDNQGQFYKVGQEFKAHYDFFEAGTPNYKKFTNWIGNRTWTFMVYLNETLKGGGTNFGRLGNTFFPEQGMAVVWNNLHPDGKVNHDTLHWGMPVEEGEKYIITKWYRERGTGAMFVE